MAVAEAKERISSNEFTDWMAYAELEPFGEERADLRAGIIASTIANVNRGRHSRSYGARDFMPVFDGPRIMSAEELQDKLFSFAKIHNAGMKTSK
jgi:hypothetical protein